MATFLHDTTTLQRICDQLYHYSLKKKKKKPYAALEKIKGPLQNYQFLRFYY